MGTSYLSQVSSFETVAALWTILAANLAITLIHILQEWKGEEVPQWRVLGAIVGFCVPHSYGFAAFTATLLAALWLAGLAGIAGVLGPWWGVCALGFIVGGRISDSIVSHWWPYAAGYRPNPGLSSTVLYIAEAAFLLWTFRKGLLGDLRPTAWGLAAGAALFVAVRPILGLLRWLFPALQREPWVPGQPIPAWTRDRDCSPGPAEPQVG